MATQREHERDHQTVSSICSSTRERIRLVSNIGPSSPPPVLTMIAALMAEHEQDDRERGAVPDLASRRC